jgi:hypothetical protein
VKNMAVERCRRGLCHIEHNLTGGKNFAIDSDRQRVNEAMAASCLGFFAKSTTSARLINEIFPKGYKNTDDTIFLNTSKITRLAEYAASYPQYIPDIGELINVALRKELKGKNYGLVEAYITIFRGVISTCCEADVMPFMQPYICNALMLLLRSSSTRTVCKASGLFFDYTELYKQCDVSLFLPVVLSLCDRNDYKIAHSEHEIADDQQIPSTEELESCQMIGYQMLIRSIDIMMSYPNESLLNNQLPNIIPCIWRAITSSLRDDSSVKQMGWDCLSLLATGATEETLSLVLKGCVDLFESLEWTHLDTVVDVMVAVRDASFKADMQPVPVVQTLLAYAQSLIIPEITVSADNDRGGLLGRLATAFVSSKDQKQTPRLLTWVAGVLTVVELFMSRPLEDVGGGGGDKGGKHPSPPLYGDHFEDDLEHLLAIQLFLCVISRHDHRIADIGLPLPLVPDGACEPAGVYRKIAESIKSVEDATGDIARTTDLRETPTSKPTPTHSNRLAAIEESRSGTRTVDTVRSCHVITDDSVTAVCKLVWRCVAMVAQYADKDARCNTLPCVLKYLEAAENRIRSLCERVAAGGGMVGMGVDDDTDNHPNHNDRTDHTDQHVSKVGRADRGDEDDHTMRLMQGRADDQVSVDGTGTGSGVGNGSGNGNGGGNGNGSGSGNGNGVTISSKSDGMKSGMKSGPNRRPNTVLEGLQAVCANVLTTYRVYVLYSVNILLTSSAVLCGPSLLDGGLPLTGEAVCHLCLLIQAGEVSVTRQAVCVLIHLLHVRMPSKEGVGSGAAKASHTAPTAGAGAAGGSNRTGPMADNPWLPFTSAQVRAVVEGRAEGWGWFQVASFFYCSRIHLVLKYHQSPHTNHNTSTQPL